MNAENYCEHKISSIVNFILAGLVLLSFGCKKNDPPILPTITTHIITSIDKTTATGGGMISNDGGAKISARGICWSITSQPTITSSKTSDGVDTGNFISHITGLTAHTLYYVRAYATNSVGTAYGNEINFTTIDTVSNFQFKAPDNSHSKLEIPAGLQAQANKDSINAILAVSYLSLANSLGSYAADFTLPGGQETTTTSNGAVYFWTYSDYSYWMTYSVLSDKYSWTYEWQTPDLARFTYISAEEARNGASGNWKIYDAENAAHAVVWDYSWTLTGSVYNSTMNFYQERGATAKFVVVDNGNKSGNFKYFEGTSKKADITWNTNGSGTYWFSENGTDATGSGSWTASGK